MKYRYLFTLLLCTMAFNFTEVHTEPSTEYIKLFVEILDKLEYNKPYPDLTEIQRDIDAKMKHLESKGYNKEDIQPVEDYTPTDTLIIRFIKK